VAAAAARRIGTNGTTTRRVAKIHAIATAIGSGRATDPAMDHATVADRAVATGRIMARPTALTARTLANAAIRTNQLLPEIIGRLSRSKCRRPRELRIVRK
jgi:hypothetical protein